MSFAKSELKELTPFKLSAALTMKYKPQGNEMNTILREKDLTWLGPSCSNHTSLCVQGTLFEAVLIL